MKRTPRFQAVILLSALLLAPLVASAGLVEAVQFPAWLERGGKSGPLVPGTIVTTSDRIFTGDGSRVLMKMSDGSSVKLGEKAVFSVERQETGTVYRAAFHVISGAFRFTTDPAQKDRVRDVTIRVRNVTAGIRGTDLWGRATDDTGLVCLLEGSITVETDGHAPVTLGKPLDFFTRKRDAAPVVDRVAPAKVEEWAQETELQREAAVGRIGGRWRVVAGVFPTRPEAQALHRALRSEGYPTEVIGPEVGPYAVQVPGLAGEIEARSLMSSLRSFRGVSLPSVLPMP